MINIESRALFFERVMLGNQTNFPKILQIDVGGDDVDVNLGGLSHLLLLAHHFGKII